MKENTDTISEILFTHCPSGHIRRNLTSLLFFTLKRQVFSFKRQLQSGMASLGIGAVFMIAVYLFLSQLAEYGWQ